MIQVAKDEVAPERRVEHVGSVAILVEDDDLERADVVGVQLRPEEVGLALLGRGRERRVVVDVVPRTRRAGLDRELPRPRAGGGDGSPPIRGLSARHPRRRRDPVSFEYPPWRPRRRRDPSPRRIHVAAAAESRAGPIRPSDASALARPTAADDPARSRGIARSPRHSHVAGRRDPSAAYIHAAKVLAVAEAGVVFELGHGSLAAGRSLLLLFSSGCVRSRDPAGCRSRAREGLLSNPCCTPAGCVSLVARRANVASPRGLPARDLKLVREKGCVLWRVELLFTNHFLAGGSSPRAKSAPPRGRRDPVGLGPSGTGLRAGSRTFRVPATASPRRASPGLVSRGDASLRGNVPGVTL